MELYCGELLRLRDEFFFLPCLRFSFSCLEGKCTLGNVAEHSRNDAYECVRNRWMFGIYIRKETHQHVADKNEGHRSQQVAEQLNTPVQVRFREYNVPGHDKARRKAETECDSISSHFRGYFMSTPDRNGLPVQHKVDSKELNKNVQHRIGTTASQVAEGLCRYPPRHGAMKEINKSQYDMSYSCEHVVKVGANVNIFLKCITGIRPKSSYNSHS